MIIGPKESSFGVQWNIIITLFVKQEVCVKGGVIKF